jgi:hypothetical protein
MDEISARRFDNLGETVEHVSIETLQVDQTVYLMIRGEDIRYYALTGDEWAGLTESPATLAEWTERNRK